MAKRVDFLRLPVKAWQQGDTVAAYRNGRVVRIPIFGESDAPDFPDLAEVATTGKYSDLLNKPTLGTAAAKDSTAFATADQGTKADTAYGWGDHSQAGYAEDVELKAVAKSGSYSDLTSKPTIPSSSDVAKGVTAHGWGNHADEGYVKTNTTYATGTLAQLNAGTDTTGRLQTAKNLNDWLVNKGYVTTDTTYTASTGLNLTDTSFSVKYGTAAGTAAQGNDSRINNGQTAYGWGNHADAGYAEVSSVNTALGAKVDKVTGKGLSTNDYSDSDKSKLAGVTVGATKNATDAQLRARSSHTGTQTWDTISNPPATATRWPSLAEVTGTPANYPTTWASVAAKPAQATRWPTHAEVTGKPANYPTNWATVSGKPTTYAPSTHSHPVSQVTGLGSAATKNVGTGSGNVMEVGAFGLGAATTMPNPLSDDIDRGDRAIGFYSWRGSAEGALPPVNDKNGALIHTGYRTGGTGSPFAFQLATSNMDIGLFFRQLRGGNGWTPWREMLHTGNFNPSNYYTKAQTDALVAGATSGSNVWQNATTALIKNAYNKVAFPSPKTLTLPPTPTENDYVAILVTDGDMKGSTIARNGKTIMGAAEDMTIDMKTPYLRLDYVAGSWRIAS